MKRIQISTMIGCLALWTCLAGCQSKESSDFKTAEELKKQPPVLEPEHDAHEHEHDHSHAASHGGALVEIGDHVAHLELVLDSASGKVTAYVTDAHAEEALSISQPEIDVTITPHAAEGKTAEPVSLKLVPEGGPAADPAKTGGTIYTGESETLKGVKEFEAKVATVKVGDEEFKDLKIAFPGEAHEDHEDHDHKDAPEKTTK